MKCLNDVKNIVLVSCDICHRGGFSPHGLLVHSGRVHGVLNRFKNKLGG